MTNEEILKGIDDAVEKLKEVKVKEPQTIMGTQMASSLLTAFTGHVIRVLPRCPDNRFYVGGKDTMEIIAKSEEGATM